MQRYPIDRMISDWFLRYENELPKSNLAHLSRIQEISYQQNSSKLANLVSLGKTGYRLFRYCSGEDLEILFARFARIQIEKKEKFMGYSDAESRRLRGPEVAKSLGMSYHSYRKKVTIARKKVHQSLEEYDRSILAA